MTDLRRAYPAGRRPLTVRRLGVVTRPGLIRPASDMVRTQLLMALGPTLVGDVHVACFPPHNAPQHIDEAASTAEQAAVTRELLAEHPTWCFVVGTAHQLWPQLHAHLS